MTGTANPRWALERPPTEIERGTPPRLDRAITAERRR
jgi:hypothetical protein